MIRVRGTRRVSGPRGFSGCCCSWPWPPSPPTWPAAAGSCPAARRRAAALMRRCPVTIDASADLSLVASLNGLAAGVGGLCQRMDQEHALRQRAAQSFRQVPLVKGINVNGTSTISHVEPHGPPAGFYWSIRRLTAYGYTAGTVTVFK